MRPSRRLNLTHFFWMPVASPGPPDHLPRAQIFATARGNGYAFLKLYRRTNDPIWLDRARQFAMTAIVQYRGSQAVVGRGRYSLWTGDVGLAMYLWDCITGEPRFPTIDVF